MIYAILSNNQIHYAPRKMHIGNHWIWNPTPEMLMAEGYLPVIETEPPETDAQHYAEPHWTERDGQIVQVWEAVELPPEPDDISPDEALDIILGGAAP